MIVDIGEVDGMSRSSSYSGCQGWQLSTCEWPDDFLCFSGTCLGRIRRFSKQSGMARMGWAELRWVGTQMRRKRRSQPRPLEMVEREEVNNSSVQ